MRQRLALVFIGFLFVISFWYARSSSNVDNGVSGFDHVNAADEENFEAARGGINIVPLSELPAESFGETPTYDPSKPDLIFHVGPVKTGTDELRNELLKYKKGLKEDNFVFLEALDGFHTSCQHQLSLIRQQFVSMSESKKKKTKSLQDVITALPCWKTALDALKRYKPKLVSADSEQSEKIQKKISVIISDSQFAQQLLPDVFQIGPATLDWISIRDTIMKDWNIVIVTSYLRYYEWLPSAKAATEQFHLIQHTSSLPRLARWPGDREKGMVLEPLFPNFVRNALQKLDLPYTTRTIDMYRPYVSKTQILNLYVPEQSIATTFLCDVLESASSACVASQSNDLQKVDSNATSLVNPKAAILDERDDLKWYDFQLYDELVTTSAARGLIRTKRITRTTATATTQYYVEKYMKLEARKSLPLTCPPPDQLRHFLDESLSYERAILGSELFKSGVAHHKQEFQKMVDDKMFCSINMRAVLRQQHWRSFFRHLTDASAQRIQAGGQPGPANRKLYVRL
jgi:hypothetical protein